MTDRDPEELTARLYDAMKEAEAIADRLDTIAADLAPVPRHYAIQAAHEIRTGAVTLRDELGDDTAGDEGREMTTAEQYPELSDEARMSARFDY